MTSRIYLYVFTLAVICVIGFSVPADAQYITQTEGLTSGQPVNIFVPNSNQLTIISHPGSAVSTTRKISLHSNRYRWVPKRAGIYELSTPGGPSQVVSVRFGYFPIKGLIVLIIAFTVLFGGAVFASYNVFTQGSS